MNVFEELANEFLDTTSRFHGMVARPNETFYSLALVGQALQWLRADLSEGREPTPEGERFIAAAAAYLGYLAYTGYERRGFEMKLSAQFEPGAELNHLALFVARTRGDERDTYDHDFLRDTRAELLRPDREFPVFRDWSLVLESLSLPSPEYLYMLGIHFLESPFATGSWPSGDLPGGTEEDFAASRRLLVEDLHRDINVPLEEEELVRLSAWVVWPPYGHEDNPAQRYNLMTLVDQIGIQKIVSLEDGIAYLRAMLCSQLFQLRNLAARTLMVLGQAPAVPEETAFYLNAVNASDAERVAGAMIKFRWVLEGNDPETQPADTFVEETVRYWEEMLAEAPREDWTHAPILRDPLYRELSEDEESDAASRMETIETLRAQYPGDWFADVAYGTELLRGADPALGQTLLREAIEETPGDATGHYALAAWLLEQGDREAAGELYADAIRRRPWDPQAVSNGLWYLTRPLTR